MATTDLAPAAAPGSRRRPPPLREWLAPALPGSPLLGWLGPLLVTLFAGYLRFHRLGSPNAVVFDETYYAKDALALLKFGWEHNTVQNADKALIADQHANIWGDGPAFVAHPPFGKWMIAIGEWMFGATPFGWRFVPAVAGTLSVLILCRVARKMTGSTLLGCAAGLLLALDGLQFVTSRAALLDIFVMFWILAGFACLVNDRERSRRILAERIESGDTSVYGPFLAHGWRYGAGVCLGLACATKWTGVFYIAAFGLMVVLWDYGARRAAGVRAPFAGTMLLEAVPAFVQLVVVGLVTYLVTWWGWIFKPGGWGRGKASGSMLWRPFEAMPDLWRYHKQMLDFHTGLDDKHPYQSWPWDWPILRRPVAFFYTQPADACGAGKRCSREILGIGTPALWWGALIALVIVAGIWLMLRDWRAGAILVGFLAGWLTWFPSAFSERTMFLFYATPLIPFMVLAIVLVLGYLIGPAPAGAAGAHALRPGQGAHDSYPNAPAPYGPDPYEPGGAHAAQQTASLRRLIGAAAAGAFLLVVLANFAYFYPILAAQTIPYTEWQDRIWFKSWV
ncbi:dolichyl-phosphate-mannose--protein mannosyltransferase [Actinomadura decatromicini]|uniref:Polyprenol-phosphate-mannose--protein mannosyltransferase n=1 Tax=Actinomadura decatromicini TaxID=2604572 RepID=A0A5D3FQH6_9ACTN|nr:phospholipid carrier-dependent glycosyltransferase [Actinomadura decatromicini]TYK49365.1 phospholipid carrier-dependent glycosyltransferase [Actinomadura decatromicini]